jgi:branched-chain amino acid transport system ATP-binding protein
MSVPEASEQTSTAAPPELLEATDVAKRFGGITALESVSLSVGTGEAVGLVGPNGAGKTTLFNCLLGLLRPESGRIVFDGRDLIGLPVHRRARLGIGRTFQRMELFSGMTVREHLLVAERVRRGTGRLWKDLLNRGAPAAEEEAEADEVLALVGLTPVADRAIESLTLGHGRLVELGRALMTRPRLLLLDEPSSGLDQAESLALARVLDTVRRERGTAVLLVEHDLAMVERVVERLYVLDFGRVLASGGRGEVLADASVRKAYLGEGVGA